MSGMAGKVALVASLVAFGASGTASAKMSLSVHASVRVVDPGGTLTLAVRGAVRSRCVVELRRATADRVSYRARLAGSTFPVVVPDTTRPGAYRATVRCGRGRAASATYRVHDPNGADFALAARRLAPQPRSSKLRAISVSATNIAPWPATTVRLCVRLTGRDATIASAAFPGSVKTSTTACSIVPAMRGGVRRGFSLRIKGRRGFAVAATVVAGNSRQQARSWSFGAAASRKASHAAVVAPAVRESVQRSAVSCDSTSRLGVTFVTDDSGSMVESDPDALRAQAIAVGLDQLPDGSLAGATRFADTSAELFPVGTVDGTTRAGLKAQAAGLDSEGDTDYDEAFAGAQTQLSQLGSAAKRAVIFLSDGLPNDDDFTGDRSIASAGTPIFTVGFGSADPRVLADIAARSGGQTFTASNAADLQAIFARIVAILTCAAPSVTTAVDLEPGATKTVPWNVAWDDGEFRSLAAWSGGKVTVEAVRPDGTVMSPTALRSRETFSDNPTYALLTGTNPAIGSWQLRLTAPAANLSTVHVSIDVFKKGLPPLPPPPPVNTATEGRWRDACAVYDGGNSTTKRVFAGTELDYDHNASMHMVCGGFGLPEELQLTLGMQCAFISAATVVAGGELADPALVTFEKVCSGTDTLNELATGNWAGVVGGTACNAFGSLFAEGMGVLVAGATVESGPGALFFGTVTYRAFSAGFKLACGAIFSGGAQSLANWLESNHESHVARDIVNRGKCLRFTQRFNYTARYSAVDCPSRGGGGGGGW